MLKIQATHRIKSTVATSLTLLTTFSFLCFGAESAPQSKPLTPEQFAQKSKEYLRYKQYVQAQITRQDQLLRSQKLQRQRQRQATQTANQANLPKTPYKHAPIQRQDILLVMPAKGAKAEDIKAAIEGAHGEVCGVLGAGGLGVLLIKARPGKVVELQRALAADRRDFKHVDFNRPFKAAYYPTSEPSFSKAWHLSRMNVFDAWDEMVKAGSAFPKPVAVFDTGLEGDESWHTSWGADCTGTVGQDQYDDLGLDFDGLLGTGLFSSDSIKEQENDIVKLGNLLKTLTHALTDKDGHGDFVAAAINGSPYNGKGACGVNPQVPVFPIKVADNKGNSDEMAMVKAMCVMYDTANTPIINISFVPNLMDADVYPIVHEFFKDWYYRKNGLIFIAAGNEGENLSMTNQPYVNTVSALGHSYAMRLYKGKDWQSASGASVDFTAPGKDIEVCNVNGTPKTIDGTSFASPIVAAVASMIWTVNPNLKNTDVERILKDSCENTDGPNTWNAQFGWGMPDALKAVQAAAASKR